MNRRMNSLASSTRRGVKTTVAIMGVVTLSVCAAPSGRAAAQSTTALEEIYILRSIREPRDPTPNGCSSPAIGFKLFATDAERFFSFWSVGTRAEDGRVVQTKAARVAELRGCFGPTSDPARQNFSAEITLNAMSFRGHGECLAMRVDFPEPGLFPVRCQLILSALPAPYVGGLLTTNTLTSKAGFGGETDPPGYTQASIATIRLWKAR